MVIAGMILFLLSVEIGILPIGKALGAELPILRPLFLVIGIAFLIGFAATVADPDVIVPTRQADEVSRGAIAQDVLIYAIAIGVGFFVAMAMLRILLNFPIAYLLAAGYIIVIILAFFAPAQFVPVAFDSGAVTTGPMAVTFVMAIAVGIASAIEGRDPIMDGFGLIALIALAPVLTIMVFGLVLRTKPRRKEE